jgi:hypothetical protein
MDRDVEMILNEYRSDMLELEKLERAKNRYNDAVYRFYKLDEDEIKTIDNFLDMTVNHESR